LLDDAALYMKIYFLGVPASLIFNFAAGLIRAEGDTKRPLYILTVSGVINVICNLFFVIVCHLGVAGVAIATAISNVVSMVLIVAHMLKLDSSLKYVIKDTKIYKREFIDVLRIGIPSGMSGMMFSISNAIIQSSINIFPETTVAGNTAASNIEGFIYTSMNTFYQASQTFTSQNLGAGKIKRINRVLANSLIIVAAVGVSMCALALTFSRPLLSLYVTGDNVEAVIAAGVERMTVICTTYYFCGMMDVVGGSLRGMKYSFSTMIISMLGACAFRIIWLATVFKSNQTVFNIYVSYPISWILTLSAYIVCYVYAIKKLNKRSRELQLT
jgi:Na+-driven multidrug efflux pump